MKRGGGDIVPWRREREREGERGRERERERREEREREERERGERERERERRERERGERGREREERGERGERERERERRERERERQGERERERDGEERGGREERGLRGLQTPQETRDGGGLWDRRGVVLLPNKRIFISPKAARAFSEYLPSSGHDNHNGAPHLVSDTSIVPECESPAISRLHNNNLPAPSHCLLQTTQSSSTHQAKRRLSTEEQTREKPSRVYTITREGSMTLGGRGSEESLELEVLKTSREQTLTQAPIAPNPSCNSQPPRSTSTHHRSSHHRGNHHHGNQPQSDSGGGSSSSQPLKSSGSASNIRDWGLRRGGSREVYTPDCVACIRAPCQSQRSLDLDIKPRKKLERMYSEDRALSEDKEDGPNSWFPKENMFSFQTATTTMQAIRNFRKHLRMVGSRRVKVQTFVDRRAKSFSRSWSDPTPVKTESLHDSRDSGDLQTSAGNLEESLGQDTDWEDEREQERAACEGDDFIPPKIMLISSKVPKAEYVPNIIRRDDPSIIPILYDHEHATFDDILEEIEKKLTAYRKGCRIWNMLIFGGPGHLYLLKNKLIQTLKRLMRPSAVEFKSPLELSAQGKEMIETYFDFRLFRLWKSRQHSKLLDYDDLL
ncbi:hypothetical protein WMY93_004110 [Mugilogobius chulae]|uniref:NMDA receptor synaptonuclear signaling and neuronal migration factor n=1 Tax=Mugilogobius chulae TaxID=88201 RepID=A0AAW0PW39_9GOBI